MIKTSPENKISCITPVWGFLWSWQIYLRQQVFQSWSVFSCSRQNMELRLLMHYLFFTNTSLLFKKRSCIRCTFCWFVNCGLVYLVLDLLKFFKPVQNLYEISHSSCFSFAQSPLDMGNAVNYLLVFVPIKPPLDRNGTHV